jgi:hypothetical protein
MRRRPLLAQLHSISLQSDKLKDCKVLRSDKERKCYRSPWGWAQRGILQPARPSGKL